MIDWIAVGVYAVSLILSFLTLLCIVWLLRHRKNGHRLWLVPLAIMTVINIGYFILVIWDSFYPNFLSNQTINYLSRFDRLFMVATIFLLEFFSHLMLKESLQKAKDDAEKERAAKQIGILI
jgi:glucan phosphoethanolaminetransferase (alkaline phosphatase superfamily)